MTLFSEIQKVIVKDYIARDIELVRKIYRPHIHGEELNMIYDDELTAHQVREITDVLADGEVIAKIYTVIKFENRLIEMFVSDDPVSNTDLELNEWKLLYEYMGKVYESGDFLTPYYAILELKQLIEHNELWKLFEDESNTDFLLPINNYR